MAKTCKPQPPTISTPCQKSIAADGPPTWLQGLPKCACQGHPWQPYQPQGVNDTVAGRGSPARYKPCAPAQHHAWTAGQRTRQHADMRARGPVSMAGWGQASQVVGHHPGHQKQPHEGPERCRLHCQCGVSCWQEVHPGAQGRIPLLCSGLPTGVFNSPKLAPHCQSQPRVSHNPPVSTLT